MHEAVPFNTIISPCVDYLAERFGIPGGPRPKGMMVAIGGQESKFQARDQLEMQNGILVPGRLGPATGFYQFELNGGVLGVMRHPASRRIAEAMTAEAGIPFEKEAIWAYFATPAGDELSAIFARLLLLTDPVPLPELKPENERVAWEYYLRNWKPGKPHERFWAANWKMACDIAGAEREPTPVRPVPPPAPATPAAQVNLADVLRRLNALEAWATKVKAAHRD